LPESPKLPKLAIENEFTSSDDPMANQEQYISIYGTFRCDWLLINLSESATLAARRLPQT
jgi:hypothetical protein